MRTMSLVLNLFENLLIFTMGNCDSPFVCPVSRNLVSCCRISSCFSCFLATNFFCKETKLKQNELERKFVSQN